MPQADQPDPLEHLRRPVCLRCRGARTSLTCTEEEYPGYIRRMFECPVCGETMTQWVLRPLQTRKRAARRRTTTLRRSNLPRHSCRGILSRGRYAKGFAVLT